MHLQYKHGKKSRRTCVPWRHCWTLGLGCLQNWYILIMMLGSAVDCQPSAMPKPYITLKKKRYPHPIICCYSYQGQYLSWWGQITTCTITALLGGVETTTTIPFSTLIIKMKRSLYLHVHALSHAKQIVLTLVNSWLQMVSSKNIKHIVHYKKIDARKRLSSWHTSHLYWPCCTT